MLLGTLFHSGREPNVHVSTAVLDIVLYNTHQCNCAKYSKINNRKYNIFISVTHITEKHNFSNLYQRSVSVFF